MSETDFRCALRDKKGGFNVKYYFGEPSPGYPQINYWKYNVPGKIIFNGSTLIFTSKNFTPKQSRKNLLLKKYIKDPESIGTLILKLDLNKTKKIKKYPSPIKSYNFIGLHFHVHGCFLEDNINDLNFTIRAKTKDQLNKLYKEIMKAKSSKSIDPDLGSLKII